MSEREATFASAEIEMYWGYIQRSFERLLKVYDELPDSLRTWRPPAPETNAVYNLVKHTLCNAEINFYQVLLGREYFRDRDAEFAPVTTIPVGFREDVAARIEALERTLSTVGDEVLERRCQHFMGSEISGREAFVMVIRHAAEHVGHAELTRDLALAAQGGPSDAE